MAAVSTDMEWIPIGRGNRRDELEKVIETLRSRWAQRYDYRIEQDDDEVEAEPFRLLLRHL